MEYQEMMEKLSRQLSQERFGHCVRVSETAERLAGQYGVDPRQAKIAGLLHDCAKEYSDGQLLQMAGSFAIEADAFARFKPSLLHGPVAAKLAEREYGVSDPAVLKAIAQHTTGGPQITKLNNIIYMADYIEPKRDFPGVDKLRALAAENLDKAMVAGFDLMIDEALSKGRIIHPVSIAARNEIVNELKLEKYREKHRGRAPGAGVSPKQQRREKLREALRKQRGDRRELGR